MYISLNQMKIAFVHNCEIFIYMENMYNSYCICLFQVVRIEQCFIERVRYVNGYESVLSLQQNYLYHHANYYLNICQDVRTYTSPTLASFHILLTDFTASFCNGKLDLNLRIYATFEL